MNIKNFQRLRFPLFVLSLFSLLFVACNDDNDPYANLDDAARQNVKTNEWILENMQFWYYWNETMSTAGDKTLTPDNYFETLLVDEDRFSWIQDNYQELLNSLKGISKESGYEFVLYRESEGSENVIAQIVYVKANSPASAAGLERGDVITHVNNVHFTTENYSDLIDDMKENHTIQYKQLDLATESLGEAQTLSMSPVEYSENPNHLSKIIDADGRKIGYYVYTFFANGPTDGSQQYNNAMDQVFSDFKAAGITDLVLDLRFNSGGAETAANNLASLIGSGVNNSKIFTRREYNDGVNEQIINDPEYGEEFLTSKFINKAANIGSQLTGNRVYILTSTRTASASELVINSLKPFMDVFIIGNKTYGKNVGSISLYDEEDPNNKWGMQPIVVKVYNSLNQSDYGAGFTPNVLDPDNSLFLRPLGDPQEALLAHAIGQITGTATGGRFATRPGKEFVGHSLDHKRRGFELVVGTNALPH